MWPNVPRECRYPLRGKFLNPRDSGVKSEKIASNKCIQDLIKILGLRRHVDYTEEKVFKTLRYGHCMIMADQDNDGSHIKGLVINFLHWYVGMQSVFSKMRFDIV